jgi:ABC-type multidrug transport system fused ATPase/permease subunit
MTETVTLPKTKPGTRPASPFQQWLLEGYLPNAEGIHEHHEHKKHPWWQVMCLTGVDYFSTLGYQPGIAALAAGALSPFATLILVLVTLFGALPIYNRVARESPHGEGSITMLAHLLSAWRGKLFVLVLLGFVATDFVITITLSAADATAHVIENPFTKQWTEGHTVPITLILIALLGAIFLKGFKEAIGIAVALVGVYLALNGVVVARCIVEVVHHPSHFPHWLEQIRAGGGNPLARGGSPVGILLASLLLFPKLALGLSGFETGVAVMPLVQGKSGETEKRPKGRIQNTRYLLFTAAIIMSVFLIATSLVTTLLIEPMAFQKGGQANGRALAYLAHRYLGEGFGSIYDISTILILWFAGASAMAGLLNIVPRYLPRYGMAPEWTRATRPLVIIFTLISFAVTIIFNADVDAQGGAYATGVLVLMTSAAVAVMLSIKRMPKSGPATVAFGLITLVFAYTTVVNVIERPDGVKIAAFFIGTIVLFSLISRIVRTTELRTERIELDENAQQFLEEAAHMGEVRLIANNPDNRDESEYRRQTLEARHHHLIPDNDPLIFLEVYVQDASEFSGMMKVEGVELAGYRILRVEGVAIPNAIAALLLYLRDSTGRRPHAYFNWTEGNPFLFLVKYLLLGQGDIAPLTHEILRVAEPVPEKRPAIHVGF